MRTSSLATALLGLALAPSLAACDEKDGSFATTSASDRNLILYAATGDLAMGTTWFIAQLAGTGERTGSACPRVTRNGDDVAVTGDCTVGDTVIEGSATLRGFTWDDDGNVELTGVELRDFRYGADGLAFDGDLGITLHDDGRYDLRQDVVVATSRFAITVDGQLTCTGEGAACAPTGAYTVRTGEVGTALVAGAWLTEGAAANGTISLSADDQLVVDFAIRDDAGCFAATLDGAATDPICFADRR
jgi:hypothetical protein